MGNYTNSLQLNEAVEYKMLISDQEKLSISQVLVDLMLNEIEFPIERNDKRLSELLKNRKINKKLSDWLLADQYNTSQEIALRVKEHNPKFIDSLTAR